MRRQRRPAPTGGTALGVDLHVKAAVNRGAAREENLETLGITIYMGPNLGRIARAARAAPARSSRPKGARRMTPRS
jgi:alkylhydroperoxidase/carboxymuconolactone decarboxylase family protein YurZ